MFANHIKSHLLKTFRDLVLVSLPSPCQRRFTPGVHFLVQDSYLPEREKNKIKSQNPKKQKLQRYVSLCALIIPTELAQTKL